MLARSHILLFKTDLSELVSKYTRIVCILPRVGYWVTIYNIVCYILLTLLRKRKMLSNSKYHGNTLLIEILSFYYYAFFRKLCTPPPSFRARYATVSQYFFYRLCPVEHCRLPNITYIHRTIIRTYYSSMLYRDSVLVLLKSISISITITYWKSIT